MIITAGPCGGVLGTGGISKPAQPSRLPLCAVFDHLCHPVDPDPPQSGPIVVVVIDKEADPGVGRDVRQPLQLGRRLRLVIDHVDDLVRVEGKGDRDQMWTAVWSNCGEMGDRGALQPRQRLSAVHSHR